MNTALKRPLSSIPSIMVQSTSSKDLRPHPSASSKKNRSAAKSNVSGVPTGALAADDSKKTMPTERRKGGRSKKKAAKAVETADTTTSVNFDQLEKVHSSRNMSAADLKLAFQFYGETNKDVLREILVSQFNEGELEEMFKEMKLVQDDKIRSLRGFITNGTLCFDDLNQRFIGVPAPNMSKNEDLKSKKSPGA